MAARDWWSLLRGLAAKDDPNSSLPDGLKWRMKTMGQGCIMIAVDGQDCWIPRTVDSPGFGFCGKSTRWQWCDHPGQGGQHDHMTFNLIAASNKHFWTLISNLEQHCNTSECTILDCLSEKRWWVMTISFWSCKECNDSPLGCNPPAKWNIASWKHQVTHFILEGQFLC